MDPMTPVRFTVWWWAMAAGIPMLGAELAKEVWGPLPTWRF